MTKLLVPVETRSVTEATEDLTPSTLALTRLMRDVREEAQRVTAVSLAQARAATPVHVRHSDD